jgi:hypothetical protein
MGQKVYEIIYTLCYSKVGWHLQIGKFVLMLCPYPIKEYIYSIDYKKWIFMDCKEKKGMTILLLIDENMWSLKLCD